MFEDLEIPSFLREAALQSAKINLINTSKSKQVKLDISRFYNLKSNTVPTVTNPVVATPPSGSDQKIGKDLLAQMKKSDAIRHLGTLDWPIKRIMAALDISYQHVYVTLRNQKK